MIIARSDFFRLFAWCLTVFFTLVSIPNFGLIAAELTDLIGTVAYAAEEQTDTSDPTPNIPSEKGQTDTADNPDGNLHAEPKYYRYRR